MKKIALLSLLGMFALTACNNRTNGSSENTDKQAQTEGPVIGGDKDENGCLVAAGETWSEIKQSCIQIFDIGQRLNPIDVKQGEAVISTFVLFNDDKSKLELFISNGQNKNTVLDQSEEHVYQNDVYKFDSKESALYINGEKKYEAEK